MSVVTSLASATTTRVQLGTGKTTRRQLIVCPDASVTAYIGGSSVTAANGYPLEPGDSPFEVYQGWSGDQAPAQSFYAITAAGTASLRVLELVY